MSHARQLGKPTARMRRWGALVLGSAAMLSVAAPAAAQEGPAVPDPMTTNIPYTAWAGTQVRMVKCSNVLEGLTRNRLEVLVESWSGSDNFRPQVLESSIDFVNRGGERCVRFNVVTLGDGIARIKLKAFDARRDEILEHQFLADLDVGLVPRRSTRSARPTRRAGPPARATEVGDPAGDGAFAPSLEQRTRAGQGDGQLPVRAGRRGRSRTTGRPWRRPFLATRGSDQRDLGVGLALGHPRRHREDRGPCGRLLHARCRTARSTPSTTATAAALLAGVRRRHPEPWVRSTRSDRRDAPVRRQARRG